MKNLNTICKEYLRRNGITTSFCAEWCGCDKSRFQRWLGGQRPISKEIEAQVLLFLRGDFLTPLDQIIQVVSDN